jgi:hypothetical protein
VKRVDMQNIITIIANIIGREYQNASINISSKHHSRGAFYCLENTDFIGLI